MKGTCTGCDNVTFIQNKKYGLCGECVYKKNHKGKSRQEVQMEKQKMKWNMVNIKIGGVTVEEKYEIDGEAQKNIDNQNIAERKAIEEEGVGRLLIGNNTSIVIIDDDFPRNISKEKINNYYEQTIKKRIGVKKSKPKQISTKQAEINKLYKLTCIDMDHVTEPVCTGCLKYQGGDIKLSHSHIISREDCNLSLPSNRRKQILS